MRSLSTLLQFVLFLSFPLFPGIAEDMLTVRDIEGVPFTRDAATIQEMRQAALKNLETWNLLSGEEGRRQRVESLGKTVTADLPAARRRKKNPRDLFEAGREGTLVVGRLYTCDKCDRVHFRFTYTAFALTEDGLCVTNYHCLDAFKGPSQGVRELHGFVVRTWDGRHFPVSEILAGSQPQDIAIFRVDLPEGETLTPLPLGKTAQVGDPVYTISHPKGMLYRFSSGMVTRNIAENRPRSPESASDRLRMCISADYGVGSSGGPVLDERGNVVGIISATTTVYSVSGQPNSPHPQMVEKKTIPVAMLRALVEPEKETPKKRSSSRY